jgi:hypothetical protein
VEIQDVKMLTFCGGFCCVRFINTIVVVVVVAVVAVAVAVAVAAAAAAAVVQEQSSSFYWSHLSTTT